MFVPDEKTDLTKLKQEELIDLVVEQRSVIATLKHELFGKKSERHQADPEGMKPLFDEIECIQSEDEEDSTDTSSNGDKKLKRPRSGGLRKPLPSDLPRERVEHDLSESEKVCPKHGVSLERIGEKKREELEVIPAKLKVIEHVSFSYKCPCCSDEDEKTEIISTKYDAFPIGKSFASASLLAFIVVSKFQDALPLYRLSTIFGRYGIGLSRTLMATWMIKVAELVKPIENLMWENALEQRAIGCDETPVQVLNEPDRKAEQKSYMWAVTTMRGPPINLFRYDPSRGAKVAEDMLSDFSGTIVCDGLKSYDSFASVHGSIKLAACMAHIRRKFVQADRALRKAAPKTKPKTKKVLDIIGKLYEVERSIKLESATERLEKRQKLSKPLMMELKKWLDENSNRVLPKSLLGKAIRYALGQWEKMEVFLDNPDIQIDNNQCERLIRQFVIGRKNWIFSASQNGAHASASLYSLVETAKANGLDPFSYLSVVFKELPKAEILDDFEKLLPYKIREYHEIKSLSNS